jgi:hypothetical protein
LKNQIWCQLFLFQYYFPFKKVLVAKKNRFDFAAPANITRKQCLCDTKICRKNSIKYWRHWATFLKVYNFLILTSSWPLAFVTEGYLSFSYLKFSVYTFIFSLSC